MRLAQRCHDSCKYECVVVSSFSQWRSISRTCNKSRVGQCCAGAMSPIRLACKAVICQEWTMQEHKDNVHQMSMQAVLSWKKNAMYRSLVCGTASTQVANVLEPILRLHWDASSTGDHISIFAGSAYRRKHLQALLCLDLPAENWGAERCGGWWSCHPSCAMGLQRGICMSQ